ncbi:deoxyribonuclease IV [Haloplanus rubicundus]|uniref:Probable endonuclease 4 n=1 Tax=Haloplanus rubicundus TaxID=1547898 RepID=A0A345E1L4_9EURY|nr:deoxyribonuclease IV [Haloplanus rubicundus]AXG06086.1 deoxyribonuclease IV [Haloplanus rubicundus]
MRVGAHVSVAGGVDNAVDNQRDVGGNCGQIFTHSPQVWQDPNVDDDEATAFREGTAEHLDGPWVIHSSYLVNLCTPKDDLRAKSVDSMQREVDAADKLGIEYVNVHLGAHTGAGVDGGLDNAVSALDELDVPEGVTVLVESDAGSGTKLGGDFEHLAAVLEESTHDLGVCLDTAHAFAAGYDLSTPAGVDETVDEFDDVIGLEHLHCLHLNDSKHACGTNKDEHAHVGEGEIGVDGMRRIVGHPDLRDRPFVLETPTEDGKSFAWNIDRVHELAAE